MSLTPAMSLVNDYSFLLFCFGVHRVCPYMEIKHFENAIRIRIIFIH